MADGNNENENNITVDVETESMKGLADLVEQIRQATDGLDVSSGHFSQSQRNLLNAITNVNQQDMLDKIAKSTPSVNKAVDQAKSAISSLSDTIKNFTGAENVFSGIKNALQEMANKSGTFGDVGKKAFDYVDKHAKDFQDLLKSGGVTAGFAVMTDMVEKFGNSTGINEMQKQIYGFNKSVIQAGLGFGQSFRGAQGNVNAFNKELSHTINTTNKSREEVAKVREGLKDAFGSTDQLTRLGNLAKAQDNIRAGLNLTNAALLLASATGMKEESVTKMMSEAHLELGESIEGAATMFGSIALAAQKSGMSFNKAADSIMSSTKALKMWGGTVGAVSPLFEAFTRNLGAGQKGLAVDLLKQYTDNLASMGFEMRALIGLQAPGGGGKGAIGAGLEMEAALEKGPEGMAKVSENLINTIKQFTGGQVVTRQEAIENPAMERAFLIQRQLLKQMIGGNDASNTKMLGILKDIDAHGLKTGGDTESKLGELLGSGEKVQDSTTTTLQNAINKQTMAQHTHGKELLRKFDILIKGMNFDKYLSATQQALSRIGETGTVGLDVISDFGRHVGGDQKKFIDSIKESLEGMFNVKTETEAQKQEVATGVTEGQKEVEGAYDKLIKKLSQQKEAALGGDKKAFKGMSAQERKSLERGEDISMRYAKPFIQEAVKNLNQQIAQLEKRRDKQGKLSGEDAAKLLTLQAGRSNLNLMADQDRINLNRKLPTEPKREEPTPDIKKPPITKPPEPAPLSAPKPIMEFQKPTPLPEMPEPILPEMPKQILPDLPPAAQAKALTERLLKSIDNLDFPLSNSELGKALLEKLQKSIEALDFNLEDFKLDTPEVVKKPIRDTGAVELTPEQEFPLETDVKRETIKGMRPEQRARNEEESARRNVTANMVRTPETAAPVKEAINTTTGVQEKRREQEAVVAKNQKPIEQEVRFKVSSDKNTITIELDENYIKEVVSGAVIENT